MPVGIGSREHDFDFDDIMNLRISLADSSWKPSKVEVAGGSFVVEFEPPVDRRMGSILQTKKSSRFCAVGLPLVAVVTRSRPMMDEKDRQSLRGWPVCSDIRASQ
jgi:hypothetical protein